MQIEKGHKRRKRFLATIFLFVAICLLGPAFLLGKFDDDVSVLVVSPDGRSEDQIIPAIPRRNDTPHLALAANEKKLGVTEVLPGKVKDSLSGHVVGPQGRPVENAFVAIFQMEGETPRQHAIFFTQTDNLGFFTIASSVFQTFESYAVIARHENWRPATFVAPKGEVFSDLILQLTVGKKIEGFVFAGGRASFAQGISSDLRFGTSGLLGCGEEIFWLNGKAENKHAKATSLSDGSFVLVGLAAGTHRVTIDGFRFREAHPGLDVVLEKRIKAPDHDVRFDLDFSMLHLSVNTLGLVAAGAKVEILDLGSQTTLKQVINEYNFMSAYVRPNTSFEVTITHPFFDVWTERALSPQVGQNIELTARLTSAKTAELVLSVPEGLRKGLDTLRVAILPASVGGFAKNAGDDLAKRYSNRGVLADMRADTLLSVAETMKFRAKKDIDGLFRVTVPLLKEGPFLLKIKPALRDETTRFLYFEVVELELENSRQYPVTALTRDGGRVEIEVDSEQISVFETMLEIVDRKREVVFRAGVGADPDYFDAEVAQGAFISTITSSLLAPGTYHLRIAAKDVVEELDFVIEARKKKLLMVKMAP